MKRLALMVALAAASLAGAAAWAAAPVGRYTLGDETVTDNVNGLVWQRAVDPSTYTWAAARTYCEGLTLAGSSDWRLPTITELESLVDRRRSSPSLDTAAFPNTPSAAFWSSTAYAGSSTDAWVVFFSTGYASFVGPDGTNRVRCVR
jgi:hypothetical protein